MTRDGTVRRCIYDVGHEGPHSSLSGVEWLGEDEPRVTPTCGHVHFSPSQARSFACALPQGHDGWHGVSDIRWSGGGEAIAGARPVGAPHVDSKDRRAKVEYTCPDDIDPELFNWWMDTAWVDLLKTGPKASEYGGLSDGPAVDLFLIGRNIAELCGMHDAPDAVLMELGCWFYMQGKVARLVSDYQKQEPGKADSWFDAEVYAKMARRIQAVGQWP